MLAEQADGHRALAPNLAAPGVLEAPTTHWCKKSDFLAGIQWRGHYPEDHVESPSCLEEDKAPDQKDWAPECIPKFEPEVLTQTELNGTPRGCLQGSWRAEPGQAGATTMHAPHRHPTLS